MILVEAKAHVSEFKSEGKILRKNSSWRSKENHVQIAAAIEEARRELNKVVPGVRISRDTHYQLSNRIAFAYKLAYLGIETMLIYLGFLRDTNIADVGEPFRDKAHWESEFWRHARLVLPEKFCNRRISCGVAGMQMIVCCRTLVKRERAATQYMR